MDTLPSVSDTRGAFPAVTEAGGRRPICVEMRNAFETAIRERSPLLAYDWIVNLAPLSAGFADRPRPRDSSPVSSATLDRMA